MEWEGNERNKISQPVRKLTAGRAKYSAENGKKGEKRVPMNHI